MEFWGNFFFSISVGLYLDIFISEIFTILVQGLGFRVWIVPSLLDEFAQFRLLKQIHTIVAEISKYLEDIEISGGHNHFTDLGYESFRTQFTSSNNQLFIWFS